MGVLEDYLGDRLSFVSESSVLLLGRPCAPAAPGASGPVIKDKDGAEWQIDTSEDTLGDWRQAESRNYQLQVSECHKKTIMTPAVVDLECHPQRKWLISGSAEYDVSEPDAFAEHVAQEAAKGGEVLLTLTCLEAEATLRSGAPASAVSAALLGAELQVTMKCAPARPGSPAVVVSVSTQGGPSIADIVDLDAKKLVKYAKIWMQALSDAPETWVALRIKVAASGGSPGRRPPQLYSPETFGEAPDDDVVLVEKCVVTLDEPLPVSIPRQAEHHRRIEDGLRRATLASTRERDGVEGTMMSQVCVESMGCNRNIGHDATIANVAFFHDRIAEVLKPPEVLNLEAEIIAGSGVEMTPISSTPGTLEVVLRAGAGVSALLSSSSGTRLRAGRAVPIKYEIDQTQIGVIRDVFGTDHPLGPFAFMCLVPQKTNVHNLRDLMAQALLIQSMDNTSATGFMEMHIPKTGETVSKKLQIRIYVSEKGLDQPEQTTKTMHVGKTLVCTRLIPQATGTLIKNLNDSKKSSRGAELMHMCLDAKVKTHEAITIPRYVMPRFEQVMRDVETKMFLPFAPPSTLVVANMEHLDGVDMVLHTEPGVHLKLDSVGPSAKCIQVECAEAAPSGSRGLSILLEFPCSPGEPFDATCVLPRKVFRFRARELNSVGPGSWGYWTQNVKILSVTEGAGAMQRFLMFAVENDDCRQARSLLASGSDPNAPFNLISGETLPLVLAAKRGVREMVELLLDAGGDIHAGDLLHVSAAKGMNAVEVSDLLISRGASVCGKNADGDTPLEVALKFRAKHKINEVLGVEPPLLRLLRPLANQIPPAAMPASPEQLLLDSDLTPPPGTLAAAVYASDAQEIRHLLDCKCDPNCQEGNGLEARPTLLLAVEKGDVDACKMLLAAGANVHTKTGANKVTYLGVAAQAGCADVARLLINADVDVNARDRWGDRALTVALRRGEGCPLVRLLRSRGARS